MSEHIPAEHPAKTNSTHRILQSKKPMLGESCFPKPILGIYPVVQKPILGKSCPKTNTRKILPKNRYSEIRVFQKTDTRKFQSSKNRYSENPVFQKPILGKSGLPKTDTRKIRSSKNRYSENPVFQKPILGKSSLPKTDTRKIWSSKNRYSENPIFQKPILGKSTAKQNQNTEKLGKPHFRNGKPRFCNGKPFFRNGSHRKPISSSSETSFLCLADCRQWLLCRRPGIGFPHSRNQFFPGNQ